MKHLTDSQLNEYLDNALNPGKSREIESHLAACVECHTRLEEIRQIFVRLEGLPEAELSRDLNASVLANLPQRPARLWSPFFAAQLGSALGVLFWLSTQLTKWIPTHFPTLYFPQLTIPTFQLPTSYSPSPIFYSLFSSLSLLFTIPQPPFSMPALSLPVLRLPAFDLTFIAISVSMLWVIGNLTLLRNRGEAQK